MSTPTSEKGYQSQQFWGLTDDEETPELQWPRNIDVYDKMRRQDSQVMSVLRAVTLPIRRTEWRIDPNGARPEVVQLVADDLGLPIKGESALATTRTRDRFSWKEHLRLALLMLPFGHSFFEQVYRFDDQGRARLRKLGFRPQRTISQVEVAADGGLKSIRQVGGTPGGDSEMGVERLVAYVLDREGGNWLGQSLLRPAYKFWLLKDRMLRVQLQSVDRNGMGFPVTTAGDLPEGLSTTDYERLMNKQLSEGLNVARGVRSGETAGASLPPGAKLELLGVTGQLPDAEKPIRYYDEQIARAVLAHFLNLGTETGSWALGNTFADFFTLSLQAVAEDIAETATQHIVEDLVDLNWGPSEPAPRIVFDEIGSRHPATAEGIRALIDCGALTADETLETHLRNIHGLPPAEQATARHKTTTEGGQPDAPAKQPQPAQATR
ncbi:phage portal protein family protein [Glutamicibacter arilaitensis]|uniref:phage portal protein family protein n=1 Tax=Glutamicibacter arilaitensis TaxID=256701 RepID=UPI003F91E344